MKKLVSVLLALVLTVSFAVSAFALPSPTIDSIISIIDGKDTDGNTIEIRIDELSDDEKKLVDDILKTDNLKKLLGDDYSEKLQVIDKKDIYVWDSEKGEVHYSEKPELFPVTVKFGVPGVTPDKNVIVLMYVNGDWVVVDDLVLGDGTVTAEFDKLCPVVFLMENVSGTSSTVSPLTGETNIVTVVSMLGLAALAVAGITALTKKRA